MAAAAIARVLSQHAMDKPMGNDTDVEPPSADAEMEALRHQPMTSPLRMVTI